MLPVHDDVARAFTSYRHALAIDCYDDDCAGYRLLAHITFTLLLMAVMFAAIALSF
ncbi:hypothetical protein [Mycobacterium cookii]|uniref:hypothetical protein n=1 Tax=Mycobacterium cookii TaxID=1775 RepID=UPI0013CFBA03|nr:hypothetical protein [Mycobacterium cookii]MCV7332006.1 hypothetical protein [Mycobacterium cookii]